MTEDIVDKKLSKSIVELIKDWDKSKSWYWSSFDKTIEKVIDYKIHCNLVESIDRNSRSSDNLSKIAIGIAVISLVVSSLVLFVGK
jgi:hypothetical protein